MGRPPKQVAEVKPAPEVPFWETIKHYQPKDFMCMCGECRKPTVIPDIVKALDDIRDSIGVPLPVRKGARCQRANGLAGGAPNSPHVPNGDGFARAVDVLCQQADLRGKLITEATARGFNWIGVGRYQVHLEMRQDAEPRMWIYPDTRR